MAEIVALEARRLLLALISNRCPDCSNYGFVEGPRGGVGQNIFCANPACRSGFNVAPRAHILVAERIGKGAEKYYPPRVHILHHGRTLCTVFYDMPPSNWPVGHSWCGSAQAAECTCPECLIHLKGIR